MVKKLEFYINDKLLDVSTQEQMRFFLTFSIADINSLEAIKNSVSKTITFAGTDNNRKLFGFAELPSAGSGLDQTTKPPFRIDYDGTSIMQGFVKMVEPRYDIKEKTSEYRVVIVGDNGDWKAAIKSKNLNELDFSEQDHPYTAASIDTSETVSATRDYVYPLINYGNPSRSSIGVLGEGTKEVAVGERHPAWQVSSLVEKIFNTVGYKLSSSFFSGSGFGTKLYLPFTGEVIMHDNSFTANGAKHFRAGQVQPQVSALAVTSQPFIVMSPVAFDKDTPPPDFFDTDGLYDNVTNFDYTVGIGSNIEFHVILDIVGSADPRKWMTVSFKKNGVVFSSKTVEMPEVVSGPNDIILAHSTGYHEYANGDKITIDLRVTTLAPQLQNSLTIRRDGTAFFNTVSNEVVEGATVPVNNTLPDMLQTDFLVAIKTLFNLYFYADIDTKTIVIEPRDDFYTGAALNWTNKINHSKPIRSRYLGENLNRTVRYKYTEDSEDGFVQEIYLRIPPERKLAVHDEVIANQFSPAGIKEVVCSFSPTYMTNFRSIGFTATFVPHMRHEFKVWWDPTAAWFTNFNHRILYYDGVQSTEGSEGWQFSGGSRATYPRFYSYSTLRENENSLNFNDGTKSVGLFKKFYKNTHRIIDEGKVITMDVYLTEKDINTLNFRKPIEIEIDGDVGQYTLNKIPKYTPVGKGSSIVEFLQFLDVHPPPTSKLSSQILTNIIPDNFGDPIDIGGDTTDVDIDVPFDNIALGGVVGGGTPNPPIKGTINLARGMTPNLDGQVLLGQHGRVSTRFPVIIGGGLNEESKENAIAVDQQGVILGREGLAGFTLLPAKNLIDSSIAPPTEVDGDIFLLDNANGELEVDSILHQSGTIIRYSSAGADLSGVTAGDYLRVTGSTNVVNDGTFVVKVVNDASDFIELHNIDRTSAADDEATSPAKMSAAFTDYDGAGQGDWIRFNNADDLWYNIPVQKGIRCYLTDRSLEYIFTTKWIQALAAYAPKMLEGFEGSWLGLGWLVGIADGHCRNFLDTFNIIEGTGFTLDLDTTGPNGRDSGATSALEWWATYVIADTTGALPNASLASTLGTVPGSLPSGYDVFRQVGWIQVNSANTGVRKFFEVVSDFNQRIRRYYTDDDRSNLQPLLNGNSTIYLPISLNNFMPFVIGLIGHFQVTFEVTSGAAAILNIKPTGMTQTSPPTHFTEPSAIGAPTAHEMNMPMEEPGLEYKVSNAFDIANIYQQGFTYGI